jgi:U32 family peptidase
MAELLAPAGNLEKLKVAVAYGADAVYFGLKDFSLRSYAGNFTLEEAAAGISHLHDHGVKGYAALNVFPFDEEFESLIASAQALEKMNVDAIIVSDLGVLSTLRAIGVRTPVHISTQANNLSSRTVMAWKSLGASRVNLARELSLSQIEALARQVNGVELEVFVHGAVCMSYSGRCAISDYLTGRRANHGECTHPCRWKYRLEEEKRPGEYLPVTEDDRGLYVFNSRDLALFSFVRKLQEAGVSSFKIEGRMKSIHYLATVVSLYRRILDGADVSEKEGLAWLGRVMNRGYSFGFMKGSITPDDYRFEDSQPFATSRFLGIVEPGEGRVDSTLAGVLVDVRNRIEAGETVEYLTPGGDSGTVVLPALLPTLDGEELLHVNHGKTLVLPFDWPPWTVVRRVGEASDDPLPTACLEITGGNTGMGSP